LTVAAASVAIIAGIGMSWSRGSWLALAAALLVVMGFREVRGFANRRLALITLAVLLAGGLVISVAGAGWLPGGIAGRLSDLSEYVGGFDPAHTEITDANFSVLERIAHWRAGLTMFSDHPWLGIGIGNYAAAYPQYAPPHWYEPLGHAHNVGIHLLAETGILGGLSFLLFWLALLLSAWRGARTDEDPRETKIPDRGGADPFRRALAIGLAGTWTYLTIHGIFDNLFVQHMQLQLALLWGGLAALRTGQGSESELRTS
jgi:O-antigen ligase